MIVAVIPAHQEEAGIAAAIQSLQEQSLPPDWIVVAVDNCTDRTAEVAEQAGATVFLTQGNSYRKAGALNQALTWMARSVADEDLVLVMDADTSLVPAFIETAVKRLQTDPGIGAVGGVFRGTKPTSWLEQAQYNEWIRYARQLKRSGRVQVLSGTAALLRMSALRAVMNARGSILPGVFGDVYNREAATEDFCLTVALKRLGYRLASPSACQTVTELMPSFAMLWAQRTRWYGGALQVLEIFGLNRTTLPYFGQQVMLVLGVLGMSLYLGLTAVITVTGQLHLTSWAFLGVVFWAERIVTAWSGGIKSRLFALLFVPEILYDLFLQAAFVASAWGRFRGSTIEWKHLVRTEVPTSSL